MKFISKILDKEDGFRIVIIAYIIVFGTILAGVAFGACNLMGVCNSDDNKRVRVVFSDPDINLIPNNYVLVNGQIGIIEKILSNSENPKCLAAVIYQPSASQIKNQNIASIEISSSFEIAQINFDSENENDNGSSDINCNEMMENNDEIPTIFAKRISEKPRDNGGHKYKFVDFNLKTALDPIITKNEPQISSAIGNYSQYLGALATNEAKTTELIEKKIEATEAITELTQSTKILIEAAEPSAVTNLVRKFVSYIDALAINESRTEKLIDKKIEATGEIAELARKSGNLVATSDKLIKDTADDVRQIVVNTRHITGRFKTLLSEFNVSLNLVNRLLKHIEPLAITKFFKNIAEIKSTLEIQSRHVQDIKLDVRDISEEVENFVQIFIA